MKREAIAWSGPVAINAEMPLKSDRDWEMIECRGLTHFRVSHFNVCAHQADRISFTMKGSATRLIVGSEINSFHRTTNITTVYKFNTGKQGKVSSSQMSSILAFNFALLLSVFAMPPGAPRLFEPPTPDGLVTTTPTALLRAPRT